MQQLLDKHYIITNTCSNKLNIDIFNSLTSTNEYLKKLPTDKYPSICLAEQQTQGKGRLGRNWYSPFAQNIYLSCRYLFASNLNELTGLSLIVALAVIEVIEKFCPNCKIIAKWPNDIMYQDQKIAGILIDAQAEKKGCSTIIGIGVNVNMVCAKKQQITQSWTSIAKILGHAVDRNEICVVLINTLLKYLQQFTNKSFMPLT